MKPRYGKTNRRAPSYPDPETGQIRKHHKEGEPCRKCGELLILRKRKNKHVKPGQSYYFKSWLHCPGCRTDYFLPEERVDVAPAYCDEDETDEGLEQQHMNELSAEIKAARQAGSDFR